MLCRRYSLLLCILGVSLVQNLGAQGNAGEFFELRVRPLLAEKCYTCHTTSQLGGLRLDSKEALLKGGSSGPAVVPGQPEQSLLIQAVSHTHERLKMPPQGKLTAEEIAHLTAWVKAGAYWPEEQPGRKSETVRGGSYVITPQQRAYWAFQPVRKPALPAVKDTSWVRSPIDRFILAALESRGLKPVQPADKRTWIRRASFDLIGLPPKPEEVEAFLKDTSARAQARVIERLLASPHYGERWGRYWLDIARYADDTGNTLKEDRIPNAFRYRDWVIQAFNEDMPYDLFVKAQIAGDQLEGQDCSRTVGGLGFYALTPGLQDDRVDVTTRGFLALTAACAQCHDHKFDPIPTKDYYGLLGIFNSTESSEFPLAPDAAVEAYRKQKKSVDEQESAIKEFLSAQSTQLAEILAAKTGRYMMAAWKVSSGVEPDVAALARRESLDAETLERWVKYLQSFPREHPFLKDWDELVKNGAGEAELNVEARKFQQLLLSVEDEKKSVDRKNLILTGGSQEFEVLSQVNLASLQRDRYVLWSEFFSEGRMTEGLGGRPGGVLRYDRKEVERFLAGEWKSHLELMQGRLEELKKQLSPPYPFFPTIKDVAKPANIRVYLRGNKETPGEEAPRRFLSILSEGEPVPFSPFSRGSGRLELAEAIASPKNPLTARVMVNRIWKYHFGTGIVPTTSNFGQLGERPSHPELLDYLAARFVESGWSIKAMHREIMLSATYALSTSHSEENFAADAGNRLLWRSNRRRLDAEALRDSILFATGSLDTTMGGEPVRLSDEKNHRRTVYGFVSRAKLDGMLSLFDFPDPNYTSDERNHTDTPLQRLFFLNSPFIMDQAEALVLRLKNGGADTEESRIRLAYRWLFQREPTAAELALGLEFLRAGKERWPAYAQALFSSSEFIMVN